MRTGTRVSGGLLLLSSLILLAACGPLSRSQTRAGQVDSERFKAKIRQAVINFQVNARELDAIYDRLHEAAVDAAGRRDADPQLGYIQKTYLYVHQARIVAAYQIRLLSNYPYIKPDRQADFLTLRALDLDEAISRMEDAASFLEVYAAFIQNSRILAEIEKARQLVYGNVYLYENLLETIRPGVNPAIPFSRDPYALPSRGV